MPSRVLSSAVLVALLTISLAASPAASADWPTYRHDAGRSGVTDEQLAAPLHLQWVYRPKQPPQPAWPEPGKELNRLDFDYAHQVAVADGLVYFGSSADCKVYALDLATGQERWSFFTDGPVRFAPTVWQDRLFVVSDDGYLYCLSAAQGRLLWKLRGGPRGDRLLGNGRIISRWPLRSGVLVDDGVVYFVAGTWPSEGVFVCAVRADTGEVVWRNGTSGSIYMKLPHPGAEAMAGVAPQGYVLAAGDTLLVPTGRSVPAGFDRQTGRFLYYWAAENKHNGGSWATVAGNLVFCARHPGGPDIDIRIGEAAPAPGDGLMAWHARNGSSRFQLVGKHRLAVAGDTLYASGSGSMTALDMNALSAGTKPGECTNWQAPCGRTYSLIVAGNTVFAGLQDKVVAFDATQGGAVWTGTVEGQARGLAAADGRLLVSTSLGDIACFGAQAVTSPAIIAPELHASPYAAAGRGAAVAALADRIIAETGIAEGYCLDYGAGNGRLAYELARRTDLQIYCLEPDAKKAAAARRALDAAGLYGTRVTVHQGPLDELPHPSYFADLIVSGAGWSKGWRQRSAPELYRVLRPCGGVAYLASPGGRDQPSARELQRWLQAAAVPSDEIRRDRGVLQIVRGQLPGAGSWTHQYADAGKTNCSSDQRVKLPLELLWFGGPGPDRMMSRHWGTAAPLSVNGRAFIAGQHDIIAFDAYTGRELWSRGLQNVALRGVKNTGSNIAADDDSVYVAAGAVCVRLDAHTGQQVRAYTLPTARPHFVLSEPQTFDLPVDAAHSGTVTIRHTDAGLELALTTTDDRVTNRHRRDRPELGDSWELFFDFRAAAQRGGIYGPGAFQVYVVPATIERPQASWAAGIGPAHPSLQVSGTRSATGSETTVRLAWSEAEGLVGGRPDAFAFGVALNCSDDGDRLAKRSAKFVTTDSYRLTNGWATFGRQATAPGDAGPAAHLLPEGASASLLWGFLAQSGDLLFGSAGTRADAQYLFAVGRDDGRPRWLHQADETIPHNAIAVGDGRVFLIDRTSQAKLEQAERRGETLVARAALVALDAAEGTELWRTDQGLGGSNMLWYADGVLLATTGGGMAAYSAEDGHLLWRRTARIERYPVIVGDTIYAQPFAYDLRTGEPKLRRHPLTGAESPWSFRKMYGCGHVSGAPTMLFFRSGAVGFCDLVGDTGITNFAGIRPGCFVNVIAANGLVLVPEASSACTCSYNFQTSVALMPSTRKQDWFVFAEPGQAGELRHLAVNLGAPGDRRDHKGMLWLSFPRPPAAAAAQIPVTVQPVPGMEYYQHNPDLIAIQGTAQPWLYASGGRGLGKIQLRLPQGAEPVPRPQRYTVRLHFAELDEVRAGERLFDVKVQDQVLAEGLDVAGEAGGPQRALVKEFKGVEANDSVVIELVGRPQGGQDGAAPILSAIELELEQA